MPIRQRYARDIEKEIAKGKGLTEAGHRKAADKTTTARPKQKSKVDNESWVSRLKGKVKAYFAVKRLKEEREKQRKFRLATKRKKDEAIIAKARARGARI